MYDEIRFNVMVEWSGNTEHLTEPLRLDQCTMIIDHKKFIDNHIATIKRNKDNPRFGIYFTRLEKYYNKINGENGLTNII